MKKIKEEFCFRRNDTRTSYDMQKGYLIYGKIDDIYNIITYNLFEMWNTTKCFKRFRKLFVTTSNHEWIHYLVPDIKDGSLMKKIENWFNW